MDRGFNPFTKLNNNQNKSMAKFIQSDSERSVEEQFKDDQSIEDVDDGGQFDYGDEMNL